MAPKAKVAVPSRQWSCSELTGGHEKLVKVKLETPGKDQLELEIKESYGWGYGFKLAHPQYITPGYCVSNLLFQEYEKKLALLKKAVDKKGVSDPSLKRSLGLNASCPSFMPQSGALMPLHMFAPYAT